MMLARLYGLLSIFFLLSVSAESRGYEPLGKKSAFKVGRLWVICGDF